jgi:hypothetical protein
MTVQGVTPAGNSRRDYYGMNIRRYRWTLLGMRRSGGRCGITTYIARKVRSGATHMRTSANVIKVVRVDITMACWRDQGRNQGPSLWQTPGCTQSTHPSQSWAEDLSPRGESKTSANLRLLIPPACTTTLALNIKNKEKDTIHLLVATNPLFQHRIGTTQ